MASAGLAADIADLLCHALPEVRVIGLRLTGKLGLAALRREVEGLLTDDAAEVSAEAAIALAALNPDGGRGNELLNRHSGYQGLKAHQASEILYDVTVAFCDRFISRRSRTHDQMVQAARSGKQNIVEGSAAAGVSSKTEFKLVGVARASLEELLCDYRDFLRQRSLAQWAKDDPRTREIRRLAYNPHRSYAKTYRPYIEAQSPEVAANTAICLVCQTTYLLDRLLKQLKESFVQHGGLSERMTRARMNYRRQHQGG